VPYVDEPFVVDDPLVVEPFIVPLWVDVPFVEFD